MTVLDLITSSLKLIRVIGADDKPQENDANDALSVLNMMLSAWSLDGQMLYYHKNELYALVSGQSSYYIGPRTQLVTTDFNDARFTGGSISVTVNGHTKTVAYATSVVATLTALAASIKTIPGIQSATFSTTSCTRTITIVPKTRPLVVTVNYSAVTGSGGFTATVTPVTTYDFDGTRPIRIENAFSRDSATYPIDRGMEIVPNEKFQQLDMKTMAVSYPSTLCYTPLMPAGLIRLWPVPSQAGLTLGITQYAQLTELEALTDEVALPPGYEMAIRYNLALQIAPEYGVAPTAWLMQEAAKAKQSITRINAEPVLPAPDYGILSGRGHFNIYAGGVL